MIPNMIKPKTLQKKNDWTTEESPKKLTNQGIYMQAPKNELQLT